MRYMRTKKVKTRIKPFQGKIRNNKLSSVELAMGKLIQFYLVCVGEFLVCMQFNAKIKQNKKKKKQKKQKKKKKKKKKKKNRP